VKRTWAKLAVVGMSAACGSTERNDPQDPASSGGGGMASGGASGAAGTVVNLHVCRAGVGCGTQNPREERFQFQGTNGTFEDHCDDSGQLVQYLCASAVNCTPSPQNPCTGDMSVPYTTGEVYSTNLDCPCADGVCPEL